MKKSSFGARSRVHLKLGLVLVASAFVCSACLGSTAVPTNPNGSTKVTTVPLDQQLLNAGITELGNKQYKEAVEDFDAAYGLVGSTTKTKYLAQYDLGVSYAEQADYSNAIISFQKSLQINPDYSFSLNDLAILESKSDPQLAISLYLRLLKTNPADRSGVYTSLGNLYIQTGDTAKGERELALASSASATQSQVTTTTNSGTS